jgi:hypothetical protein
MMRTMIAILWILCLLHVTHDVSAQTFTPATFGEDDRSILKTLRVPNERPSGSYNVSLRCQVIVETDGAVTHPHCLVAEERFVVFQRAALRALSGSVMTPATVDAQSVRVVLNFLIGYLCDESCEVVLVPNHSQNVDSFGLGYVAPQPILEDDRWYEGYASKLDWVASGRTAEDVGGIQFIVSTRVNESGRASRTDVDMDSNGFFGEHYEDNARRAAKSLKEVRYIPGFYEGNPRTMRLHEYWLDPDAKPPTVLTIPVRVLRLVSEIATEQDSALAEAEIRELFVGANEIWKQAAIEWTIESIQHARTANEQASLRAIQRAKQAGLVDGAARTIEKACPEDLLLEGGWNLCILPASSNAPGGYYSSRIHTVIFGGAEFGPALRSRLLAHELGHSLNLAHTTPCARDIMGLRSGNLPGNERCEIPPLKAMRLELDQIARSRAQALKQEPRQGPL